MELFTPIVESSRQHPNFRAILSPMCGPERNVLDAWATGFEDRDGKFVIEFQTTFNSSFWELYLNAAFRSLGVAIDYKYPTPDFACKGAGCEFVAEAVVASNADGFAAEWEVKPDDKITSDRAQGMLEYASIRLANAIDAKLRKYRKTYASLSHVTGRPFIVCLAPFEQPQSFAMGDRALRRVLYAYDMPIYIDRDPNSRIILGETRTDRSWKESGAEVPFGLFNDTRAREISAVIYSNTATFGKLGVLAPASPERTAFITALRYNDRGLQPNLIRSGGDLYEESLLDGLHVFLNPNADHPVDPRLFLGREVAVHYGFEPAIGAVRSDVPDGFLISRSTMLITTQDVDAVDVPDPSEKSARARGRMPAVTPWPEGKLVPVGGRSGPFTDNHLANYRGWTILVVRDEIDDDWGAQACRGTYTSLASWIDGQKDDRNPSMMLSEFLSTQDEAFDAIKQMIDARETTVVE